MINEMGPLSVNTFSQAAIDEGRLHYVQSMSNQTTDSFIFDVTNGISSLSGLVFHFLIIPKDIYIETRPVHVTEGEEAFLSLDNIHVLTSYYEDKIADFLLVSAPLHGSLVATDSRKNVSIFTVAQLKGRQIKVKYCHGFIKNIPSLSMKCFLCVRERSFISYLISVA